MRGEIKRLKNFLSNNAGMKILAVLLATVSFYAIRGRTGLELPYDIPLEVVVEEGVAVLEKEAQTVQVTLRGSPDDHRRLQHKQIRAVIRPRTVALSGSEKVHVEAHNIEGASGVTVVKIKPSSVLLTFDREAEKQVRVEKPRTTGTPLIGRAELAYEPEYVTLRGPRLRLRDLETVTTEPIDVDGRVESFSKTVRVLSPGDKWVPEIEPNEITVRVRIVTELVSRSWTNVPVLAIIEQGTATTVRFEPPTVSVTVEGRAEIIDGIANEIMKVFVNCLGLDLLTTNPLPVSVHLPPGYEVTVQMDPETVRIASPETE